LRRYPDVAGKRIDPVAHYIKRGAAEGRDPTPDFNTNDYYERYSDVSRDVNAFYHYIKVGRAEGRSSTPPASSVYDVISAEFDRDYYLRRYPDVAGKRIDPVVHYIEHGAAEGRDPSPDFNTNDYYERYSDVSRDVNAFYHYIKVGRAEGRSSKSPVASLYDAIFRALRRRVS
jgi:hypothetical protein